jgi:hypothetical protein
MVRVSLVSSSTVPDGYTFKGTVNVPGEIKNRYLILSINLWIFSRRYAWEVV